MGCFCSELHDLKNYRHIPYELGQMLIEMEDREYTKEELEAKHIMQINLGSGCVAKTRDDYYRINKSIFPDLLNQSNNKNRYIELPDINLYIRGELKLYLEHSVLNPNQDLLQYAYVGLKYRLPALLDAGLRKKNAVRTNKVLQNLLSLNKPKYITARSKGYKEIVNTEELQTKIMDEEVKELNTVADEGDMETHTEYSVLHDTRKASDLQEDGEESDDWDQAACKIDSDSDSVDLENACRLDPQMEVPDQSVNTLNVLNTMLSNPTKINMEEVKINSACLLQHGINYPMVHCKACKSDVCLDCHLYKKLEHLDELVIEDVEFVGLDLEDLYINPKGHYPYTPILKEFAKLTILKEALHVEVKQDHLEKVVKIKLHDYSEQTLLLKIFIMERNSDMTQFGKFLDRIEMQFILMKKIHTSYFLCPFRKGLSDLPLCIYECVAQDYGSSLLQIIYEKRELTEGELISIFQQLTQVLSLMHKAGIYNSDLQPQNILFNNMSKEVKICNLEYVHLYETGTLPVEKKVKLFEGIDGITAKYHSPEVLKSIIGKNSEALYLPEKADMYSLGMTMYQLITQESNYQLEVLTSNRLSHKTEKQYEDYLEALRNNILIAKEKYGWKNYMNLLISLVLNCLEYNPEDRLSSFYLCMSSSLLQHFIFKEDFRLPSTPHNFFSLLQRRTAGQKLEKEEKVQLIKYKKLSPFLTSCLKAGEIFELVFLKAQRKLQTNEHKALTYYRNGLEMAIQLYSENSFVVFDIMLKEALFFTTQEDFIESNELLERASKIGKTIFPKNHSKMFLLLESLGTNYMNLRLFHKARHFFSKSYSMITNLEQGTINDKIVKNMINTQTILQKEKKYREVFKTLEKILELQSLLTESQKSQVWGTFFQLGSTASELKSLEEAYQYYSLAVEFAQEQNNKQRIYQSLEQLAGLSIKIGHHSEGQKIYLNIQSLREELGIKINPYHFSILGSSYQAQGNNKNARMCFLKGMEIIESHHGPEHPFYLKIKNKIISLDHPPPKPTKEEKKKANGNKEKYNIQNKESLNSILGNLSKEKEEAKEDNLTTSLTSLPSILENPIQENEEESPKTGNKPRGEIKTRKRISSLIAAKEKKRKGEATLIKQIKSGSPKRKSEELMDSPAPDSITEKERLEGDKSDENNSEEDEYYSEDISKDNEVVDTPKDKKTFQATDSAEITPKQNPKQETESSIEDITEMNLAMLDIQPTTTDNTTRETEEETKEEGDKIDDKIDKLDKNDKLDSNIDPFPLLQGNTSKEAKELAEYDKDETEESAAT